MLSLLHNRVYLKCHTCYGLICLQVSLVWLTYVNVTGINTKINTSLTETLIFYKSIAHLKMGFLKSFFYAVNFLTTFIKLIILGAQFAVVLACVTWKTSRKLSWNISGLLYKLTFLKKKAIWGTIEVIFFMSYFD